MRGWLSKREDGEQAGIAAAIDRAQAVIQFDMQGNILHANQNFLDTMGYSADEVRGQHHRMFVDATTRDSEGYRAFWDRLRRGEFCVAEFGRVAKGGRAVWLQASYNPVAGPDGKPIKVVKFATDITERKHRALDDAGKIAAIDRVQAVIAFERDGTIVDANENFLAALGHSRGEIVGRHHRMFLFEQDSAAASYADFWNRLGRGEFQTGEFRRRAKDGREIWILASYNPILDEQGRTVKVVKFATDITEQKIKSVDEKGQLQAIGRSQATIEFGLDGAIRYANDKFLGALGYQLDEIKGRHHSMFVDPAERGSATYQDFWAALNRGEYQTGEFRRIAKGGREIWIQASYNPILDVNGKPYKVVKYASDVTAQALARVKAERARTMIDSVAAGAEELNASVREISETMVKSRQTASEAGERVASADAQVQRLTAAAKSMNGIVELINNITGQINLLALNATIESARAGEAGRGFAVVAAEVKNLANQAKQATDRIAGEIGGLTVVSGDVVGALQAIRSAFDSVSEYVNSTAAAVEEQSVVTSDMSQNMQLAAAELS